MAVIYQDFSLVPDLSVAENIALGREPERGARGLIDRRALRTRSAAEARAQVVDLPMERPVRALGVADQQLTEIVKALSRDARILVMDEPYRSPVCPPSVTGSSRPCSQHARNVAVGIVYISHFLEEVFTVLTSSRCCATVTSWPRAPPPEARPACASPRSWSAGRS